MTIDAEVPVGADLSITSSRLCETNKASPVRPAALVEEIHNFAKPKLAATANAARGALLFTSPSLARKISVPPDLASIPDSSLHDKASSVAAGAKPGFNPFLKDFSSKKEEQVHSTQLVLFSHARICQFLLNVYQLLLFELS